MSLGKAKKSLSEYSTGELVMFRFRKNKLAMFGVVLLAVIVVTILIAPLISSYDAVVQMNMAGICLPAFSTADVSPCLPPWP